MYFGRRGQRSWIRFTPANGPPSCCTAPPVTRPPRSMAAKPASSNSAVTADFASASSPERKITRRPPPSCGSAPSTAAPRVFAAFTTRARDELGENLARGRPVEVAGVEVVRRVDDDPRPSGALDGLADARPRHGDDDDVG